MDNGWIKVYRKIIDNRAYFTEQFCRQMAWIDMLLIANHADGFIRVRGVKVPVLRGQIGYSNESLTKRWKWSKGKVIRFLNELENDLMIVQQKSHVITLISILNYDFYQSCSTTNDTANSKTNGSTNGLQTVQQTDTNKKDKKEKNEKRNTVPPSLSEVLSYFKEHGFTEDSAKQAYRYYDNSNWIDSKGNQVLNWKNKMNNVWFKPENKIYVEVKKMVY